ncbi:MAG: 3-hydroxyacyl-CoA dehydrogenase/enoyl-CoA hydratase/3-hydroxybutyryl-CoA epimerase, partial [Dinoroseobacter sp.]
MTDFTLEKHADGAAIITWDCPGRPMNVLTREAFSLV